MKMEITVAEALELINEIRKQPNDLFEMIRTDVKESVGRYLSELILARRPSLDLSIFSPGRILENRPVYESSQRLI